MVGSELEQLPGGLFARGVVLDDLLFIAVRGLAKSVTEWYRTLPLTQRSTWENLQNHLRARFWSSYSYWSNNSG